MATSHRSGNAAIVELVPGTSSTFPSLFRELSADLDPLKDVAHAQCHGLWDVVALLEAAGSVTTPGDPIDEDQANRMRRLVRIAEAHVRGVIDAFGPYI